MIKPPNSTRRRRRLRQREREPEHELTGRCAHCARPLAANAVTLPNRLLGEVTVHEHCQRAWERRTALPLV